MPPDPSNNLRKQDIFLSHHGSKTRNISMIIQFYPNNPDPAAHACEDLACPVPTFAYPDMIEGCRFKMENLVDRLPQGRQSLKLKINVTHILDNEWTILQSGFLPSLEKEEISKQSCSDRSKNSKAISRNSIS
jgi:hypothetical protein